MAARLRNISKLSRQLSLLSEYAKPAEGIGSSLTEAACPRVISLRDFHQPAAWHTPTLAGRISFARLGCGQRRSINIDQHGASSEELSEKDYHRFSDLTLGELLAKLEAFIEETPDLADSDLEYQQGVLTLNLGSHGTYVINKQGPNKQIWMSSPVSGPVRYDFVDGTWIYKHDGHKFHERLAEELGKLTGRETLDLDFEPQLEKGFVGYGADPT